MVWVTTPPTVVSKVTPAVAVCPAATPENAPKDDSVNPFAAVATKLPDSTSAGPLAVLATPKLMPNGPVFSAIVPRSRVAALPIWVSAPTLVGGSIAAVA